MTGEEPAPPMWDLEDIPHALLLDMAMSIGRKIVCQYYRLDPLFFDTSDEWMKETSTHKFVLIGSWMVCVSCNYHEAVCCCDGRLDG